MKAEALSQVRASLLNILTRSDRLRLSPGLEMTASINRLADQGGVKRGRERGEQQVTEQYIPRFTMSRYVGNFRNFSLVMFSSLTGA